MRTKAILALLALALLLAPGARTQAMSGDLPATPKELLEQSEIIVIGRAGELLGARDKAQAAITSFHNLHVESYIRPAAPGPDTLVLGSIGGITLWRAMNGPNLGPARAIYFLKQRDGIVTEVKGPFTPTLPLDGDRFVPGVWELHARELGHLLSGPRYPAYPKPAVRVNGRQIGTAELRDGRSYLPADLLNAALGLKLQEEGLLPVRWVAETKGAQVLWKADEWVVEITYAKSVAEPVLLSEAQAVERLAAHVQQIMDDSKLGRSFADTYAVSKARLDQTWIDPVTGGVRPVWLLSVDPVLYSQGTVMIVLVDAVTGEVLYQRRP